jgi:spermidine/putrescine transport system ATP-binding protein
LAPDALIHHCKGARLVNNSVNNTPPSDIEFCNVVKRYGEVQAVSGLDFAVRRGSFHSFLGGSGCGKTTTLRMIAGF